MQTILRNTTQFKHPVRHYATYRDIEGIAELMAGGYLFRPDQGQDPWLVAFSDVDLFLFGRCDLADAQAEADGDLLVKASRTLTAPASTATTVQTVLDAVHALAHATRQAAQAHTVAGSEWEADTLTELARQLQRLANRALAQIEP
jgi:hypothetical protein